MSKRDEKRAMVIELAKKGKDCANIMMGSHVWMLVNILRALYEHAMETGEVFKIRGLDPQSEYDVKAARQATRKYLEAEKLPVTEKLFNETMRAMYKEVVAVRKEKEAAKKAAKAEKKTEKTAKKATKKTAKKATKKTAKAEKKTEKKAAKTSKKTTAKQTKNEASPAA